MHVSCCGNLYRINKDKVSLFGWMFSSKQIKASVSGRKERQPTPVINTPKMSQSIVEYASALIKSDVQNWSQQDWTGVNTRPAAKLTTNCQPEDVRYKSEASKAQTRQTSSPWKTFVNIVVVMFDSWRALTWDLTRAQTSWYHSTDPYRPF